MRCSCWPSCTRASGGFGELVAQALEPGPGAARRGPRRRELELALATGARLIGVNNRDLRTLEVDIERADRLRALVPGRPRGHRRVGGPRSGDRRALAGARLRRRARRRGPDAGRRSGGSRALVRRGRAAARRSGQRRAPAVREDLRRDRRATARSRRSRPGRMRSGSTSSRARHACSRSTRPPRSLPGSLDRAGRTDDRASCSSPRMHRPSSSARLTAAIDPDAIQFERPRNRSPRRPPCHGRAGRRSTCRPSDAATPAGPPAARSRRPEPILAAGAERILLDTAGGPHPGGTGSASRCRSPRRSRGRCR